MTEAKPYDLCRWKPEGKPTSAYWISSCGMELLLDGSPQENEMRYCPFCGQRLTELPTSRKRRP